MTKEPMSNSAQSSRNSLEKKKKKKGGGADIIATQFSFYAFSTMHSFIALQSAFLEYHIIETNLISCLL